MDSLNIIFTGPDEVITVQEPVREPGEGELLIEARWSLISTGTECICLSRLFEEGTHWHDWVRYPFWPGYSWAGVVAAIGPGVSGFQLGDRVAARVSHRQRWVVGADRLTRIPEGVSDEDATWFGLAGIVQSGVRAARPALGESVVVVGAGILGQLVTQYARLLGAGQIICIDPGEKRLAMAGAHGATTLLPMLVQNARDEVMQRTNGEAADIVFDVTGNWEVLPYALPLVKTLGRLQLLGDTGFPGKQRLTRDVVTRGIMIVGAHDSLPPQQSTTHAYWNRAKMADLFFTYLQRGDMRVSDLVTHRYSPAEAPEAYRMLREERPTALGVLFDWSQV